ncbi:hypothetical protein BH11PSE11_BH11PSE11_26050 [soil metagenome]
MQTARVAADKVGKAQFSHQRIDDEAICETGNAPIDRIEREMNHGRQKPIRTRYASRASYVSSPDFGSQCPLKKPIATSTSSVTPTAISTRPRILDPSVNGREGASTRNFSSSPESTRR